METCVHGSAWDGDLSQMGMPPHCFPEGGCTHLGLVSRTGTVPCHPSQTDCWSRASPGWQERKKPLPGAQMVPWSIFSSTCPNSQKSSVLLTDVSFPGMPGDKVAQEDGRRHWIVRTPTGHQPAPVPLPRLESPSLLPKFSAVHRSLW